MHHNSRRRALLLALLTTPTPALAGAWLSTAPSPGLFTDPANWFDNAAPSPSDSARFSTRTTHTVILPTDVTTSQLFLSDDNLSLDLAGHTYSLVVASQGPSLFVGYGNEDSSLTLISSSGHGTLDATTVDIGHLSSGNSSLNLVGQTTLSVTSPSARFTLGSSSAADLLVTDGATLSTADAYLAHDRDVSATATLDGPATSWTSSGSLYAAYTGAASITVRNGATLSVASNLALGYFPGATATLTLQDPGSSATCSDLFLGGSPDDGGGAGTLNVLPDTSLNVTHSVTLWRNSGASLNLAGGSLKLANFVTYSDPSRLHWTAGSLELTNSAVEISNPTTTSPALNYIFNPGPSLSLTPGMSLKISGQPNSYNILVIDNGGSLSADNASISVGDKTYVGYASTGTLTLSNHASLSTSGSGIIGSSSFQNDTLQLGAGAVSLDDHASWTISTSLSVGDDGSGTLAIRGGSSVSNTDATIAAGRSPASVTVDGPGSSWSSTGTLTVGSFNQGSLAVSNGACLSSATAIVGYAYSPSSATLQGPGSSWTNAATLYIARARHTTARATGTVSLSDHASLTTRGLAIATSSPDTVGSLSLSSNSTLTVSYSAYLGGLSTPGGSASLSLTDSSATIANTLKLHPTPNTSLSLTRSTLTIGTPSTPGSLDNAASITLADHSTLTLHGPLSNPGTLTLSPTSRFLWDPSASTPTPLDDLRTQLATAHLLPSPTSPPDTRLAYIESFQLPPEAVRLLAGGSLPDDTFLLVSLALTGDTNLDGVINADDYALLDRSYARAITNAHWSDGDFNYDGAVDASDYLLIDTTLGQAQGFSPGFLSQRESQFGPTYVSALLASVPEPSSTLACLLAGSLLPVRRRRT